MSAVGGRTHWRLIGPSGKFHELPNRPCCTADDLLTLRFAVLAGLVLGERVTTER